MKFISKLKNRLDAIETCLCVGLDSRYDRLPEVLRQDRSKEDAILEFNRKVIDSTHSLTVVYKMNLAFYAGFGEQGVRGLRRTNQYIRENYPQIPIFADCKRSEMGASTELVAQEIFEDLFFDCVMVTPWFGVDTVSAYLEDDTRGIAVYVHDSNPSAPEFQDLMVKLPENVKFTSLSPGEAPLYEYVTHRVSTEWNSNGNIILEAGLTYPQTLPPIRRIAGDSMPILVAGYGPQGGNLEDLKGIFGENSNRLLINSSRGIIFTDHGSADPGENARIAAEKLVGSIRKVRES